MSSLKFESLKEDVEDLLDKVSKRLQVGIPEYENTEERKRIIHNLESVLNEAKSHLNKMEIESLNAPSRHKPAMRIKISKFATEIQSYRKKLNEERFSSIVDSRQNTGTSITYNSSQNLDAHLRKQVLMGTASLERTAESLERSHTIAVETEQLGTEVLGELSSQRSTLEGVRERLGDTQEEITRSKRILRAMGRNVFYNKILLITIIILEIIILGGLVFWKFFT